MLIEIKLHLCHQYPRKNTPGQEAIKEGEQRGLSCPISLLVHRARNYESPIVHVPTADTTNLLNNFIYLSLTIYCLILNV